MPLSVLIDHIDHMVKVAGIDHVGLGSDFDGVDELPEGHRRRSTDCRRSPSSSSQRGYRDEDVLKILGGNFLRVFDAAEAYANPRHHGSPVTAARVASTSRAHAQALTRARTSERT